MNKAICKLAFRETGIFVIPITILLLGIIVFKLDPLRFYDTAVTGLSILLGIGLAWRIFADYGNVRSFLFSRSFSPTRFFLVRWLFGLAVIAGAGLLTALIILLGIRQGVQQMLFANGWFPMIRFAELHVLTCYFLSALLAYHTTLYFMLLNRFRPPVRRRGWRLCLRWIANIALILVGGVLLIAAAMWGIDELTSSGGYSRVAECFLFIIFGIPAAMQLILLPYLGVYCYNNQEIES